MSEQSLTEQLAEALRIMVDQTETWNEAVQNIIGRQPQTSIGLDGPKAALARFDAAKAAGTLPEQERDELALRAREVTCVWCGFQFKSTLRSQADHLYEHAKTCEKHPIRKAEAKLAAALADAERLRRGEFTPEEFQNLCHNRDDKPGCTEAEFKAGCEDYQRKLFHTTRPDAAKEGNPRDTDPRYTDPFDTASGRAIDL